MDAGNCASVRFGGATFDLERGILYVVEAYGDNPEVHAFQIGSPNPDDIPPTVSLTAPANGATVSGPTALLSASASDDTGVIGVRFTLDGVPLGSEDTMSPYSITWDTTQTSNGNHTLTATVRDGAGNTDVDSITLTVDNPEIIAPTVTTHPQNATKTVGQTATFTVIASGSPPFSYQWQKNGSSITDATVSSYTTPALTLSDSGATFRVIVTNSVGSVMSNDATLTVSNTQTIWGSRTTSSFSSDNRAWDLGMIFTPNVAGSAVGARVYGAPNESGTHSVRLWSNSDGTLLSGPHSFTYAGQGWHEFTFPTPVNLSANQAYTVTVSTGGDTTGWYTAIPHDLTTDGNNGANLTYPANAAVYSDTLGVRPTQSYNAANYLRDIIFAP